MKMISGELATEIRAKLDKMRERWSCELNDCIDDSEELLVDGPEFIDWLHHALVKAGI